VGTRGTSHRRRQRRAVLNVCRPTGSTCWKSSAGRSRLMHFCSSVRRRQDHATWGSHLPERRALADGGSAPESLVGFRSRSTTRWRTRMPPSTECLAVGRRTHTGVRGDGNVRLAVAAVADRRGGRAPVAEPGGGCSAPTSWSKGFFCRSQYVGSPRQHLLQSGRDTKNRTYGR